MSDPIMSRTPQPAVEPDEDTRAIVSAMLDKVPPAPDVYARYSAPEAVAARAERAARQRADDWPALSRYRAANAELREPTDMVLIGDSLTEIWQLAVPDLFSERIVNRGIGGQTSPQILLRFMADVVDLAPRRVHLMCGTNDIAGNTGPNLPENYLRNVRAMLDLAQSNGIDVLVAAIPPAAGIPWQPAARPREWVPYLNDCLRDLAQQRRLQFIDYGAVLGDGAGGLKEEYSADGVHVTRAAYRQMTELLRKYC